MAATKAMAGRYSPAERRQALLVLALNGGNTKRAAEFLKDAGNPVPQQTLSYWTRKHADELEEVTREHAPKLEQAMAGQILRTALAAHEATLIAVEKAREQLEAGEAKDPSTAARNLGTTAGILSDKYLTLTGRPTQITEHRSADQILANIARQIGAVNSTAHEIPEAKQVEATTTS